MVAEEDDHFADGLYKPTKMARAMMAWPMFKRVEMRDVLDVFADIGVVEAVAGVDLEAAIMGVGGGAGVAGSSLRRAGTLRVLA